MSRAQPRSVISRGLLLLFLGLAVLALVQQRQRMLKDAWLTAVGHERPGMRTGLPLAEAQAKATELEKQIRALVRPGGDAKP